MNLTDSHLSQRGCEKLDLSVLHFFEQFRKTYLGDQVQKTSKVNNLSNDAPSPLNGASPHIDGTPSHHRAALMDNCDLLQNIKNYQQFLDGPFVQKAKFHGQRLFVVVAKSLFYSYENRIIHNSQQIESNCLH